MAFLMIIVGLILFLKLVVVQNLLFLMVFPDEITYGDNMNTDAWGDVANLSVYSLIPSNFGITGARLFNSLITSLCTIPIFYLFRKHHTERNSAILATVVSLFAPLWVYSFVNMTEALLFFGFLNAAVLRESFAVNLSMGWLDAGKVSAFINALVKPTGVAAYLVYLKYGFHIALLGGLVFALTFGSPVPLEMQPINALINIVRSVWYITFASAGMAFFTGYRVATGQGDDDDKFAMGLLVMTFAIVFGFMFKLPHNKFYGRYFDAPILVVLTTALKPVKKDKMFKLAFAACFVLALIYPVLTNFSESGGILDAGLLSFYSAIKQVLWLSNPAFPQP